MEEKIKEVIESLSDAFQRDSDAINVGKVQQLMDEYPHLNIENPENFALLVSVGIESQINLLARIALQNSKINKKEMYKMDFVYTSYHFIESHIKKITQKYEGFACSTDRSRWLIETYVRYLVDGEIPVVDEKKYWHPKAGEVIDWMIWIDSMRELNNGDEVPYVEKKQVIIQAYQHKNSTLFFACHETFTTHKHFLAYEVLDEKKSYSFEDKETGDTGTIVLDGICDIGYRFHLKEENTRATHETLPEWFSLLFKIIK